MTETKHNNRTVLASILLGTLSVMLAVGVTFSWLTSKFENISTQITMGAFTANLTVYDNNGEPCAEHEAQTTAVNVSYQFNDDTKWGAGSCNTRIIKIENVGDIDLSSYLMADFTLKDFIADSTKTITDSFYLSVTDITDSVLASGDVKAFKQSYITDAKTIYENGSTFTSLQNSKFIGNTSAGDVSYFAIDYCCYDLPVGNFTENSTIEFNANILLQQAQAPAEIIEEQGETVVENMQTVATEAPTEAPTKVQNSVDIKPFDKWSYVYTNNEKTQIQIVSYNGNKNDVVIPAVLDGAVVTMLGENAFNNSNIKTVTIPATVSYIDPIAFTKNNRLTSLSINKTDYISGVEFKSPYVVKDGFIYNSKETRLIYALPYQPYIEYYLPQTVTEIGDYAFATERTLQKLHLGTVKNISSTAFQTSKIKEYYFYSDVPEISSTQGFGTIDVDSYKKIYVPKDYYNNYKESDAFKLYDACSMVKGTLKQEDIASLYSLLFKLDYTDENGIKYVILRNGSVYDDRKYYVKGADHVAVVTGYSGKPVDGVVEIPMSFQVNEKQCPVVAVSDNAFVDRADIVTIVMPNQSIYFTSKLFTNCKSLGFIVYGDVVKMTTEQYAMLPKKAQEVVEEVESDTNDDTTNE